MEQPPFGEYTPCRDVRRWRRWRLRTAAARAAFAAACLIVMIGAQGAHADWWAAAMSTVGSVGFVKMWDATDEARDGVREHVTVRICRCGGRRLRRRLQAQRDQQRAGR